MPAVDTLPADTHAAPLQPADAALLERLTQALGSDAVREPEPRYLEEPRGSYHGRAAAVIRPGSTEDVATAVRLCAEARVGIVPYAGGTGLVGGQVFEKGPLPVLLSVERLNHIRDLDLTDNVIVAEAGCILADVQAAAREAGRLFPLSLASEGSARIGGLLGTNAGGISVLRYGNARDLCLGVEAVMADGSVMQGVGRLVKDNMGYDLRHLLIGSEGSLAIITAASLRLFPLPGETATAWLAVPSPAAALDLLRGMRAALGGTLSAFELIDVTGIEFLAETMPQVVAPPAMEGRWRLLVEATDGEGSGLARRFEAALETGLEEGLAVDALIAQNGAQRDVFWTVRETIPEANRLIGAITSQDISLPPSKLAAFIDEGRALVAAIDPSIRINCFGHLGDGNLHYNVYPRKGGKRAEYDSVKSRLKDGLHDLTHSYGGSVSAEHGVGRLKTGDLVHYLDPARVAAMRAIKHALDPLGILNPGAVLA